MKKLFIISLMVVMILVLFLGCSSVNFESIRDDLMSENSDAVLWSVVADDGSYLTIDTNFSDTEDMFDEEAYSAIEAINEKLDLPESLIEKMNSTSANDGIQTAEHNSILIRWSYHPNNGLEVMYEKAD